MNKNNKFFRLLLCLLILQSITACNSKTKIKINEDSLNKTSTNNNDSELKETRSKSQLKNLNIDNRCIGCGRCTMTDPEHFIQYTRTSKAIVKSQNNLESKKIKQAIQICPTQSIKLI